MEYDAIVNDAAARFELEDIDSILATADAFNARDDFEDPADLDLDALDY